MDRIDRAFLHSFPPNDNPRLQLDYHYLHRSVHVLKTPDIRCLNLYLKAISYSRFFYPEGALTLVNLPLLGGLDTPGFCRRDSSSRLRTARTMRGSNSDLRGLRRCQT